MPVIKLSEGAFADPGFLGDAIAGKAGILDGLPQLVREGICSLAFWLLADHAVILMQYYSMRKVVIPDQTLGFVPAQPGVELHNCRAFLESFDDFQQCGLTGS